MSTPTADEEPAGERQLDLGSLTEVRAMLAVIRRGSGDPTWYDDPDRSVWKGWRTPRGPVTVHLRAGDVGGSRGVVARAWGEGADWLLDRLPRLLGADDDDSGFETHHGLVREARRRHPRWRVPNTGLVMESLVPAIIEQRVTGAEAFASYRILVRRHGEAAPGPVGQRRLMVAPTASGWAAVPSWDWVRAGVDSQRADTVMRAAAVAGRLEQGSDLPLDAARARLRAVPGIGGWTIAEVAHVAWGDPDAVSFGDYHVAKDIGWALTGTEVDDAGLAELLEPYAGHRYRVQRLLELHGAHRPRHGARRTLPTHLPTSYRRRARG